MEVAFEPGLIEHLSKFLEMFGDNSKESFLIFRVPYYMQYHLSLFLWYLFIAVSGARCCLHICICLCGAEIFNNFSCNLLLLFF